MSRPATSRLKVNAPLGLMPALQYLLPQQLKIDPEYQRSLDTTASQGLIRRIAQFWNWDLCQPLVVARRQNGDLYVIDGQHRLEAARMRGDIAQLPSVVVQYESAADEAASFVHLNQQRRPLSKLDIFKAAIASGDGEARAIVTALSEAGLSIAVHSNYIAWKPGEISNIAGVETAWRRYGPKVTAAALVALERGFHGQVLRYAGTIFPGIVAVCSDEWNKHRANFDPSEVAGMLAGRSQTDWVKRIMAELANDSVKSRRDAAASAMRAAWKAWAPVELVAPRPIDRPAPPPPQKIEAPDGLRWCDQCDRRISLNAATLCQSRFCKLRPSLVAA